MYQVRRRLSAEAIRSRLSNLPRTWTVEDQLSGHSNDQVKLHLRLDRRPQAVLRSERPENVNSDDKSFSIITFFLCTAVVLVVFLVSSCVQTSNRLQEPRHVMTAKSEHIQRMRCIENKGSWTYESYVGGKCQFK